MEARQVDPQSMLLTHVLCCSKSYPLLLPLFLAGAQVRAHDLSGCPVCHLSQERACRGWGSGQAIYLNENCWRGVRDVDPENAGRAGLGELGRPREEKNAPESRCSKIALPAGLGSLRQQGFVGWGLQLGLMLQAPHCYPLGTHHCCLF